MKIVPERYRCEICGSTYNDKVDAFECESRGEAVMYPIGLIHGNHSKDSMYSDITFAIAELSACGHANDSSKWACRDNGAGDSLGKQMCGNGNSVHLNKYDAKLNPDHPTFKRMVNWLKENKIPITVWDGEKPISLSDFLKR